MNFNEFKQEVTNNRPRLALVYLVPVLEELIASNEAMAKELEALKAQPEPETVKEEPVKKAPAKKAAAKRSAAKTAKTEPEEEKTDAE